MIWFADNEKEKKKKSNKCDEKNIFFFKVSAWSKLKLIHETETLVVKNLRNGRINLTATNGLRYPGVFR